MVKRKIKIMGNYKTFNRHKRKENHSPNFRMKKGNRKCTNCGCYIFAAIGRSVCYCNDCASRINEQARKDRAIRNSLKCKVYCKCCKQRIYKATEIKERKVDYCEFCASEIRAYTQDIYKKRMTLKQAYNAINETRKMLDNLDKWG
jgi:hypothetical protein